MSHFWRSLVIASIFAVGVAGAQDTQNKKIPGWGEFFDPAADCKVIEADGKVTITVPGSYHDLNPIKAYNNVLGPRLMQPVEGDFTVQVKVLAFPRPMANAALPGKISYVGAGLILWQDGKSFLRCLRAANGPKDPVFLHTEGFKDAARLTGKAHSGRNLPPDEAIFLQVERRGDALKISRSPDGKTWSLYATFTSVDLSKKMYVGVAAANTTKNEFAPQWEGFKVMKDQ